MDVRHGTPTGYNTNGCRCGECLAWKRSKDRAYYVANRERVKVRTAAYHEANRDARLVQQREHRARNLDRIREQSRAYERAHRAEALARVQRWREANPDKVREQSARYIERNRAEHNRRGREWHQNNHERSREAQRAYWRTDAGKAARRAANYKRREGRLRNVDEVAREYLLAIAADPCAYCGGFADTVDHMTPLSRGGSNEWWNFTAACRSCNSRKHDKTRPEFLLELSASPPTPGLAETA